MKWRGEVERERGTARAAHAKVHCSFSLPFFFQEGHVAALRRLDTLADKTSVAYNLGTGTGTSVLEMVDAFEKASGKKVPLNLTDRRAGDTVAVWAATETAAKELGWTAKKTIEDMCVDQWRWAEMNPKGYE